VAFRDLYPPTPLAFRHLLQTIAATGRDGAVQQTPAPRVPADAPAPVNEPVVTMNVRTLARQIQVRKNVPIGVAQQEAERMIKAEKRRAAGG